MAQSIFQIYHKEKKGYILIIIFIYNIYIIPIAELPPKTLKKKGGGGLSFKKS